MKKNLPDETNFDELMTLLNAPVILLAIPICPEEDEDDDLDVDDFCVEEDHCCEDYEPSCNGTGRCVYSCPECGTCLRAYIGEEFE